MRAPHRYRAAVKSTPAIGRFRRMVTLKTYYLDVKDAVRVLHRFELRFEDDNEAIQHSKELAAMLQLRYVPNDQGGLAITVLDQSNREIHKEAVYPPGQQPT